MNKKLYDSPYIELIVTDAEDIICTSPEGDEFDPTDCYYEV